MDFGLGQAGSFPFTLYLVLVWVIFWKGVALWRAAQLKQKYWFIFFLVTIFINLFAIPELIYLFRFAKKRLTFTELKGWFVKVEKK